MIFRVKVWVWEGPLGPWNQFFLGPGVNIMVFMVRVWVWGVRWDPGVNPKV